MLFGERVTVYFENDTEHIIVIVTDITTNGQLASISWCRAHLGNNGEIFPCLSFSLTIA
jgi:hypothetical protein